MNNAAAALPFLKNAIEASPKTEQFWLSYIKVLIQEKHIENAKQALSDARKRGINETRLDRLEAQIPLNLRNPNTAGPGPSQKELNLLLKHYQNGRYSNAQKLAATITRNFPQYPFGWKMLGVTLRELNKKSEAVDANQAAIKITPQDPELHNNLGITLRELGKLEEAERSLKQAIELNPTFAEAYNNLGGIAKSRGFNGSRIEFSESHRPETRLF